jgi:hypothetical protein
MNTWALRDIICIQTVQGWGQDRTLWHSACISFGVDISTSTETQNFLF